MRQAIRIVLLPLTLTLTGCEEDKELADLAKETNQQQAKQNQEMAKLNREVAEGSKRLVQATAESTAKVLTMQQQLQNQRSDVENERQQLAEERNAESVLGPALVVTASLLAICLPLVLCWYLLHGLWRENDPLINDLLIDELDRSSNDTFALHDSATSYSHDSEV
jgi:hypothetical protein